MIRKLVGAGPASEGPYVISPEETPIERSWDNKLVEHLRAAGVRHELLTTEDHQRHEREWRKIYGHVFRPGFRHRHGAKAVYEYLNEPTTRWMLVSFLSNVPGTPMHVRAPRPSAFECEGLLLDLGQFSDIEFFVSPQGFCVDIRANSRRFPSGRTLLRACRVDHRSRRIGGEITTHWNGPCLEFSRIDQIRPFAMSQILHGRSLDDRGA